jgi:hypothetical protein
MWTHGFARWPWAMLLPGFGIVFANWWNVWRKPRPHQSSLPNRIEGSEPSLTDVDSVARLGDRCGPFRLSRSVPFEIVYCE